MRKIILPILVVTLFLTLAAVPAMGQQINIIIGKDNENYKKTTTTITVSSEETKTFINQITDFYTWYKTTRPFKDLKLSDEEKTEINTRINEVLTTLNGFLVSNGENPISMEWLWKEMFETEIGRSTIASIGRGICFIPFYDYETFIGIMLRPMWFFYPPVFLGGFGYTGNFNINPVPPRIEYGDRVGCHFVRTTMFTGLYINIGELGYETPASGLMVLLGQARVVM